MQLERRFPISDGDRRRWLGGRRILAEEHPWRFIIIVVLILLALNVWAAMERPTVLVGLIPFSIANLIALAVGYKIERPREPDPPYPSPPTS